MPYDGRGPGRSNSMSTKLAGAAVAERAARVARRRGRRRGTGCPSSRGTGGRPRRCRARGCRSSGSSASACARRSRCRRDRCRRPAACSRECSRACRGPTAQRPSFATSSSRIVSSASLMNVPDGDVEGLAEREVAILLGANHLHRLDALVGRCSRRRRWRPRRRFAALVVRRRHLFLDAEEHALVVLAPRERRAIADHPASGEAGGLRRIERRPAGRGRRRQPSAAAHIGEWRSASCRARASSRRRRP